MYNILLRDIITGEKHWYADCYYNGKMRKNQVIHWQGTKYKVLAWKWQGFDNKVSKKTQQINDFATKALLELDLTPEWKEELRKYIE